MKSILLPLLLALSVPCLAQSDYIKSDLIQAPEQVPAGSTIVIQIKGELPYAIEPKPPGLIRLRDDDGNRVLLIQGATAPGYTIKVDYQVIHPTPEERKKARDEIAAGILPTMTAEEIRAYVATQIDARFAESGSRDEFFQDSHTVKVGDEKKDDDKKDDEDDEEEDDVKPEPKPVGPYWIIFLEESLERTPEMARILADTAFLKSLTDAGHKWRVYDDDHTDARSFAALTTHRPALIVTTFSGEVVHTIQLPKTAAEISALVKGGGK